MAKNVKKVLDKKFWKRLGIFMFVGFLFSVGIYIRGVNQLRQARFNVNVLQRYIQAYLVVENKQVESLQDLPDFHLVSPPESLSLKAEDVRDGFSGGYIYDFQYLGEGRYVLSASPVGVLTPQVEFGSTNHGVLRVNKDNVDVDPDSYEEVEGWVALVPEKGVRTKEFPEYLR
ncbi:MAG: hypothetical protein KAJ18_09380 [Candidatus Omnitrophica bacterium]|nr:hypothetical protein [Candidatus Omnitrophota bacterium]